MPKVTKALRSRRISGSNRFVSLVSMGSASGNDSPIVATASGGLRSFTSTRSARSCRCSAPFTPPTPSWPARPPESSESNTATMFPGWYSRKSPPLSAFGTWALDRRRVPASDALQWKVAARPSWWRRSPRRVGRCVCNSPSAPPWQPSYIGRSGGRTQLTGVPNPTSVQSSRRSSNACRREMSATSALVRRGTSGRGGGGSGREQCLRRSRQ